MQPTSSDLGAHLINLEERNPSDLSQEGNLAERRVRRCSGRTKTYLFLCCSSSILLGIGACASGLALKDRLNPNLAFLIICSAFIIYGIALCCFGFCCRRYAADW